MNPLQWKREHKIALLCAIGLGLFIGAIVGFVEVRSSGFSSWPVGLCHYTDEWGWRGDWCFFVHPAYWLAVGCWSASGAAVCGMMVYIRQLLRA
jgi:hypothetical protein